MTSTFIIFFFKTSVFPAIFKLSELPGRPQIPHGQPHLSTQFYFLLNKAFGRVCLCVPAGWLIRVIVMSTLKKWWFYPTNTVLASPPRMLPRGIFEGSTWQTPCRSIHWVERDTEILLKKDGNGGQWCFNLGIFADIDLLQLVVSTLPCLSKMPACVFQPIWNILRKSNFSSFASPQKIRA